MTEDPAALRVSDAEREQCVERLRQAYADGRLDHEEFDERVSAAYSGRTRADLDALLIDLPSGTVAGQPSGAVEPRTDRLEIERRHAGYRRSGNWPVPALIVVDLAHGTVRLDFTEAHFARPEVTIDVEVAHGAVRLLLPDGASVNADEVAGTNSGVRIRTPEFGGRPHLTVTGELRHSRLVARVPRHARRRA